MLEEGQRPRLTRKRHDRPTRVPRIECHSYAINLCYTVSSHSFKKAAARVKDQDSIGKTKTKRMESEKGETPSDREMDSKPAIGELSLLNRASG